MENFVYKMKETEDRAFYEQIIKDFSPISDDLYVFFHAQQNGLCFFTYSYFYPYKELFLSNYNASFLQQELSDYPKVIRKVIQYYFHELTEEQTDSCLNSNVMLFEIIKKSDYSDTEKSRFYEFFMDPIPYIQKLQYELMAKEVQLSAYYEKNYSLIFEAFNGLTIDILIDQLKPIHDCNFFKNEATQIYLAFCLLNNKCINFVQISDGAVGIFGVNYLDGVKEFQGRKLSIKLDEFGAALAEESRVKMLDLMLEKGEITCKDLEKIFSFSGSTAYHHLTILLKCGVIKTRNEGKTILFSVNNRCFDVVIDILRKYSSRRKGVKS